MRKRFPESQTRCSISLSVAVLTAVSEPEEPAAGTCAAHVDSPLPATIKFQFTPHAVTILSWQPDSPPSRFRLRIRSQWFRLLAFFALLFGWLGSAHGLPLAGWLAACLPGFSFSWRNFMYFYGRLQPLTLLPLGPESGNRKLLLIMLLTLCCSRRSWPPLTQPRPVRSPCVSVCVVGWCDNVRFC